MASKAILEKLKDKGLVCGICGKSLVKEWNDYLLWRNKYIRRKVANINVDHILPRSKGGGRMKLDNIANLQLAHMDCNLKKGSRL